MNEEIKEILDGLNVVIKHKGTVEFDYKECKILLDYITNLQQEKDMYKDQLRITHKDLENYISRCEKAIEHIQDIKNITKHGIYPNYTYEVDTRELLNILQNGSDSEC